MTLPQQNTASARPTSFYYLMCQLDRVQYPQKIGPDDVKRIADYTDLPVIVKGIESPEDALYAIGAGAAGVYVSNHGGRQLNGGPASFDVLEDVAKAVNGRVPIIFDSGVRRGSDVFKALASGADLVALGRPAIYGLALGGAQGVQSVFEHLGDELKIIMQLAGTKTIADVKKTNLLNIKY
ncbi:alpha-hydroxy-acid oxidizing protein [Lentilactobacillus parafarraginis]|uniref:alpha-hydroxy-acid oxidizing protein n=1 Tax=Lentilactobacillus parafarraginis TaxID=390842 RepID=UPI0021F06D97|nr:alpha-hydroxy-acid oxidizing protein [Lentilactobacillus parafarraginis]